MTKSQPPTFSTAMALAEARILWLARYKSKQGRAIARLSWDAASESMRDMREALVTKNKCIKELEERIEEMAWEAMGDDL